MRIFVMIKSEAFERNKIGKIIGTYKKDGWRLLYLKQEIPSRQFAETLYAKHKDKAFYDTLIESTCANPVICLKLEKDYGSIEGALRLLHKLRLLEKDYLTYYRSSPGNFIYCSESEEEANTLIDLWFGLE